MQRSPDILYFVQHTQSVYQILSPYAVLNNLLSAESNVNILVKALGVKQTTVRSGNGSQYEVKQIPLKWPGSFSFPVISSGWLFTKVS